MVGFIDRFAALADLEAFISDALMERIAVEKSEEKENVDKGKANLNFDDRLFSYFMESYGRVDKFEKEYHKVFQ